MLGNNENCSSAETKRRRGERALLDLLPSAIARTTREAPRLVSGFWTSPLVLDGTCRCDREQMCQKIVARGKMGASYVSKEFPLF
jgi:hypothetical protein